MAKVLGLLFSVLVFALGSAVASASGAHALRFLTPRYAYEHEERTRKIFKDEDSSNRYFAAKIEHSRKVFESARPRIERFFAEAKRRGIAFDSLALRDEPKTIASIDDLRGRASGSVRLLLEVAPDAPYDDVLVVHLARALDAKQRTRLWAQLPTLRFLTLEQDDEALAKDVSQSFRVGFGTIRIAPRFALWVGNTDEIRPEDERLFTGQAETLADEVFPALRAALDDPKRLPLLVTGDTQRLVSLTDKLKGATPDSRSFNPWGPLSDQLGMRDSTRVGRCR